MEKIKMKKVKEKNPSSFLYYNVKPIMSLFQG